MEFKRIHINEYFEYMGVKFQKKTEKTALRCDVGVIKEIYEDLQVLPEVAMPPQGTTNVFRPLEDDCGHDRNSHQ